MRQKLFFPLLILFLILIAFFAGQNFTTENSANSAKQENSTKSTSQTSNPTSPNSNSTSQTSEKTTDGVLVTKVVDGDTIEISGGQKVRYIGMDTPETVDPRKTVQCYGKEASAKNKELVEGKKVKLVKDVSETDRYGRLLRYVYLGDNFINDTLVRQGFARVATFPPDVKFQKQFQEAENYARDNNLGLWSTCSVQGATSTNYQVTLAPTSGQCTIKGNISSSGEKIYHVPGGRYYEQTTIDESKGEKWFCSESEAVSAGWRKSKV
ncbi:MAG TPA: thermonuclease family protein [Candidatus Saccharimonadales bacterium]|nr:thermonuclease family protein [Candidatus Saccharimonadales bacterium]